MVILYLKKMTLSKYPIIYMLLLMPFFEPLVIDLLIERYPNQSIWSVLNYLFKISELLIASFIYLLWFQKILYRKKLIDDLDTLLVLHLLFMIISCFINTDFAISFLGSTFCTIALIPLSEYMIKKSDIDFLKAGKNLFGLWSLYGIISAFLFPNGFIISATKYDAIFGLGSKNNAFPFFFAYLFFLFAYRMKAGKRLSLSSPIIITGMIMAAVIYTSINTIICIGLVLGVYFLEKSGNLFFKKQNAFLCLIILIVVIVMIYVGFNMHITEVLLTKFGRNSTFSNRDVIWEQAVSFFKNSIFFGKGASLEYKTVWLNIKTQHAHSQYLDKLAKFGIFSFIFLIIALVKLFRKINKCINLYQINLLATMVLIYMLHMAFDTYNYNFYIIILVVLNTFVKQNFQTQRRKNEKRY